MSLTTRKFGSMSEWVEYCGGDTDMPMAYRQSRNGDESFTNSKDYADAESLAFNWPDGAARVETIRAKVGQAFEKMRTEYKWRETGTGTVDMARFIQGDPAPIHARMKSKKVNAGNGKVVTVTINAAVSGAISADVIEARGGAVLALVDALERQGRKVRLVAACAVSGKAEYQVTVKGPGQRLNLQTCAFAIAHPSFLRRMVFSAMEREDAAKRNQLHVGSGYGMPAELKDRSGVYVGSATLGATQWRNTDAAAQWVRNTLEDQGIKFR